MFETRPPRPTFAWGALLLALGCASRLPDVRDGFAEEPARTVVSAATWLSGLVVAWAMWRMKPWALDGYATWAKVLFGLNVGATAVRADGAADVIAAAITSAVMLWFLYALEDSRRLELRSRERWLHRHGVA